MARKVRITAAEAHAHSKVYLVSSPTLADEIVEVTVWESEADEIIYITAFEARANKNVYVVNPDSYVEACRQGFDSMNFYGSPRSQTVQQWLNLGVSQYEEEHYALAIEAFSKALIFDPHNAAAHLNRGFMRFSMKEYQDALDDADDICNTTQEDLTESPVEDLRLQGSRLRVRCYIALKNYRRTLLESDYILQRWIKRQVRLHFEHYLHRGLAFTELGRYKEALTDFERAIEIDNRRPDGVYGRNDLTALYYYRGKAYFGLKKCAQALADYDRVLSDERNEHFLGKHSYIRLDLDVVRNEREAIQRCLIEEKEAPSGRQEEDAPGDKPQKRWWQFWK